MKNYSWLPNKFVDDGVGLIINGKRFDCSNLEEVTKPQNQELFLTHTALAKLVVSAEWSDWMESSPIPFSTEEMYGPEGKLNWLWPLRWVRPLEMLSAFCTNMGGGVPIEVIQEVVDICYMESCVS